jgi:tRNA-Thr(GGU) m(6)t(6)A37 methyltransferase TsaA
VQPITLTPIGHVENQFTEMTDVDTLRSSPSRLVLDPSLTEGLLQLQPGDWLLILFYFDRAKGYRLRLYPRDDVTQPLHGVFATRSQYRPNPIGATVVKLIDIEGNVLTVLGLDALDGTPILDIKPYVAHFDGPFEGKQEAARSGEGDLVAS